MPDSLISSILDLLSAGIDGIVSLLDGMYVLAGGLLAALYLGIYGLFSRFGLALLTGLTRSAGTGLGDRFLGRGGGGRAGSRRMPAASRHRHAHHALWNADARLERMELYVEAWMELLAARTGPFALSMHVMALLHEGFQEKTVRLLSRARAFDRLEERVQGIVQRYESDYARKCEPLRDEMLALYVELARWKARGRRFALQVWKRRWRYYKRRQALVRRRITVLRWALYRAEQRLNRAYAGRLEPAFMALDQYERTYLTHWVHSFEADHESFRLTVVTGRLVEMLQAPENRRLAERLGLAELPREGTALARHLAGYLQERRAAFGPHDGIETLFEAYLRLRLVEEPGLCRRWGIERAWIERLLPAPGSIGVSHGLFGHLGASDAWSCRSPRAAEPAVS